MPSIIDVLGRARQLGGETSLRCTSIADTVAARFSNLDMKTRVDIVARCIEFINQAHIFEAEANGQDTLLTAAVLTNMATNQQDAHTEKPADFHEKEAAMLRQLQGICLRRAHILQHGTLSDVRKLLRAEEADKVFLTRVCDQDVALMEAVLGMDNHTGEPWEKMFRLKCMWTLVRERDDVDRKMKDLERAFGLSLIEGQEKVGNMGSLLDGLKL